MKEPKIVTQEMLDYAYIGGWNIEDVVKSEMTFNIDNSAKCVGGPADGQVIKWSDLWKDDAKFLSAVCHTNDGQSHWYDFKDGQFVYKETLTPQPQTPSPQKGTA